MNTLHTYIRGHIFLLIMSNIRKWKKHCHVMGGELSCLSSHAFCKLLGLRGTLAITLQLSHHYTLVHCTASVHSLPEPGCIQTNYTVISIFSSLSLLAFQRIVFFMSLLQWCIDRKPSLSFFFINQQCLLFCRFWKGRDQKYVTFSWF